MDSPAVRRALISVSDKLGVADFARGLVQAGVEIYSTGGTRRHLESEGVSVYDLSQYTGFPEMMGGRLKTLHPKVFGGILCRFDDEGDMAAIAEHGISTFEVVVVNLYPFQATISRPDVTVDEAIEQVDIGGPSLVRAAAKNHRFVTVVTHQEQYSKVLEEVLECGHTSAELRRQLMTDAFTHTAEYDRAIADYFMSET
ncbi:MAG: bifunctional phosphoribosylaminoimidazolecarboxamide formyltransferase/IMP cyclohydrolase, partial [Planctomycetes bacterium]|nr:bifunctional phosphoribosylaminoimidazolecarboxamide formyltransferase/IMP cyclohydrolase [Planctomycetota bacterium]